MVTRAIDPMKDVLAKLERQWADQEQWDAEHPEDVAKREAERAERERQKSEMEARQKADNRQRYSYEAGVRLPDDVFEDLAWNTLKPTPALEAAHKWFLDGTKPWLFLSGPTGCGKTVASAAMIAERSRTASVKSVDVVRSFAGFFGDAAERQERWKTVSMLAIDDIGTEPDADRMLNALLELMDARQSKTRTPTVVTTNLKRAEFAARYKNDRLMSRMVSMAEWVVLDGADLRRAQ